MRILMTIPSLESGGAERQFAALASGLAQRGHAVLAVTLGQGGPLAAELGQARLITLGKASRLDNLRVLLALAGIIRRKAPQVHYAFLPSCCVLGALLRPFFPHTHLAMGIRAADASGQGRAGRLLLGLESRLSRRANLVIANSEAGQRRCLERGFPAELLRVVDNGIDTARFRPDRSLGAVLRSEWGVGKDERLIGLVARLDPLKDHPTFLAAAALLAVRNPGVRFVCVGGGATGYAQSLREKAAALGLGSQLIWAGERANMPGVYNALDILCLSSSSEGFPNVLGEAMSCGVPCVATDAGDAARVLGGTGLVVAPGHAAALAVGMETLLARLTQEGANLGALFRDRVQTEFSLPRLVAVTEDLLTGERMKGR